MFNEFLLNENLLSAEEKEYSEEIGNSNIYQKGKKSSYFNSPKKIINIETITKNKSKKESTNDLFSKKKKKKLKIKTDKNKEDNINNNKSNELYCNINKKDNYNNNKSTEFSFNINNIDNYSKKNTNTNELDYYIDKIDKTDKMDKLDNYNKNKTNEFLKVNENFGNQNSELMLSGDNYSLFYNAHKIKNNQSIFSSDYDYMKTYTPQFSRDNINNDYFFNFGNDTINLNSEEDIFLLKRPERKKEFIFLIKKSKNKIYKKKMRNSINELNIEDKCFPFKSAEGLIKKDQNINNNFIYNEQLEPQTKNDFYLKKFNTRKYFINENGKKRRTALERKNNKDLIRKKIKLKFHKDLKNLINNNLVKCQSEKIFEFLPQCFLTNLTKATNMKFFEQPYINILTTDFTKELNKTNEYKKKEIDEKQYLKNKKVIEYLENNPEISENSGFDLIKNMKYKDLLDAYFHSKQFEDSIIQLQNEKETHEYIQSYIYYAENYIQYFTSNNSNKEKNIGNENNLEGVDFEDDLFFSEQ